MCIINLIALILILVGAINWGFVGFFNYNFVNALFGGMVAGEYSTIERIVYAIVGLAGIWGLSFLIKCCKKCCGKCDSSCGSKKGR